MKATIKEQAAGVTKPHDAGLEELALCSEPTFSDLLGRAVADKIEGDVFLLRTPIGNIDRWMANGVLSNPRWFLRWRELLSQAGSDAAALRRVLELLRADTEEARSWRDYSPFAGVLTSEERRRIIRLCAYSH
jgi:hypothetical protein